MDTTPERDIDIHAGLENTLTILKHRLRGEIRVERQYDPALPLICAHGGELNQVWTNLINNAIDAMLGSDGREDADDSDRGAIGGCARRDSRILARDTAGDPRPDFRTILHDESSRMKAQGSAWILYSGSSASIMATFVLNRAPAALVFRYDCH